MAVISAVFSVGRERDYGQLSDCSNPLLGLRSHRETLISLSRSNLSRVLLRSVLYIIVPGERAGIWL